MRRRTGKQGVRERERERERQRERERESERERGGQQRRMQGMSKVLLK
jgi:hypothetical protein